MLQIFSKVTNIFINQGCIECIINKMHQFIFQEKYYSFKLQILRSPAVWISNGSSDSDDFAITGINYILKYIKIEMSF